MTRDDNFEMATMAIEFLRSFPPGCRLLKINKKTSGRTNVVDPLDPTLRHQLADCQGDALHYLSLFWQGVLPDETDDLEELDVDGEGDE